MDYFFYLLIEDWDIFIFAKAFCIKKKKALRFWTYHNFKARIDILDKAKLWFLRCYDTL